MKHQFFFSGYSDDVVLAGRDKRSFDEYYATFFLLSNGMVIKAKHGDNDGGWKIEPTEMPADGVTIIPAVDEDDSGKDHDDPRIPEWFEAPGYAPVCIIAPTVRRYLAGVYSSGPVTCCGREGFRL